FALALVPVDLRGQPATSARNSAGEPTTSKPDRPRMCVKKSSIAADIGLWSGCGSWKPVLGKHNRGERTSHVALMMEEKYDDLAALRERGRAEVSKVVIGQDRTVELLLIAAVAHGHVLIEGPPGSAKTLITRAVAHMLGASFKRIQFTPDTTPVELN